MGMLMIFNAFSDRDLQNMLSLMNQCESVGVTDIRFVRERLQRHISAGRLSDARKINKFKSENIVKCKECGGPAIVVPLDKTTATHTHAIQCQNRPATDQPWRDGMCGHTEYIFKGP